MGYASLQAALTTAIDQAVQRAGDLLPRVLLAALLLLGGWLLARLARAITVRLLQPFGRLAASPSINRTMARIGIERSAPDILGSLVFWLVIVVFVTAATDTLGLPLLATWLAGVSQYLPRLVLAVLIVLGGLLVGALVRDAATTGATAAGVASPALIGRGAQAVVVLIATVTAVDQVNIDSRFLTTAFALVVGGIVGGVALAFGLGARTAVANVIAAHYVRQTYQIGHTVRVGSVEGRIVELTSTAVVVESHEGRVLLPAKTFDEAPSTLLTGRG